jgi:transketolase
LKHNPRNPLWQNRDRFILSAGHGSLLLYSLLHLTGYDLTLEDIKEFRQWHSKTPGHPEYCPKLGIEMTTGPLGQGVATGVGMAMAQKYLADYFNRPGFEIFDYQIYAIAGDGDLMEGVASEAASLAGHLQLGNIIYLYSDNRITIDGSTDLTFTEDVEARFLAYGWHVQRIDGNDLVMVEQAISCAKNETQKPSLIIARTQIGFGSPNKSNSSDCHGAPLGEQELQLTRENLGWTSERFFVPPEVQEHFTRVVARGDQEEASWNALFESYRVSFPELAKQYESMLSGDLGDLTERLPKFCSSEGKIATRVASGKVLNAIVKEMPQLLGGSADLTPSNNTLLKGYPDFMPGKSGRNIHFGVREHAMGAVLNGLALSNMLVPYGGTFLIFADYMIPSIRLSALMGTRVVFVFTHDSIGLGEDGPTHQPVEQLSTLRGIPNLVVIRPSDANETSVAWKIALGRKNGPTALILTRQNVGVLDRQKFAAAEGLAQGGYVLADCQGTPELVLLATGSEIELALGAYHQLTGEGIGVRVVNMASFELFEQQPVEYCKSVLPLECERRLAIEAASPLSWYKYVGLKGDVIGIDRFGKSAPAPVLFEKFGFTVQNVVARAKALF